MTSGDVGVTCAECSLCFTSKKNIIHHFKTTHSSVSKNNCDSNQKGLICIHCGIVFGYKGNLIKHIKKVHESKTDSASVEKCWICGVAYSSKANVIRHVKRKHPDSSLPEKNFKYCCNRCPRRYNQLYNLKFHMRKAHNIGMEEPPKHKCPLCTEFVPGKMVLVQNHLRDKHGIAVVKREIEFNSYKKFKTWKEDIERETNAHFVRFARRGESRDEYRCHRSGVFISKSKGLRKLKALGSRKIDGICPASITLYKKTNDKFTAIFIETHVGHDNDIKYLCLSEKDRLSIASKIACKVPFNLILDDLKSSASSCRLERKHLITKKDLYNIQSMYGLSNKISEEEASIDSWVVETASTNDSCIIFYKTQGVQSSRMNSKDFVLILMNEIQCDALIKYSKQMVCLDRTHCLNKQGFELITVYVLKELDAFPCVFIVTNRTEKTDFIYYFNLLREQVGCLKAKIIVADLELVMYEAWCDVMGLPEVHLYCSWHIDWAIRRNLIKIKDKSKQLAIYKSVSNVHEEKDGNSYETKLHLMLNKLNNDKDTHEFLKYFKNQFVNSKILWSEWHREMYGFKSDTNIEKIHNIIKYMFLNKSNVEHVEKALNNIMKYVRDMHIYKFVNNEDSGVKVRKISVQHDEAVSEFPATRIMEHENTWKVDFPAIAGCQIHTVNEIDEICNCSLICPFCNVCVHKYSCSCSDSSLKWNMCKHIHLLCYYLSMTKNNHLLNSDGIIYYDYISVDNQQTINLNHGLSAIVNVPPTLNIMSSFQNDVITDIADGTDNISQVLGSFTSVNSAETVETNEDFCNKITNSKIECNIPGIGDSNNLHIENNEATNMNSFIETLDQRRKSLSQKILDLLDYVQNVESVEMVDSIEKLLLPIESTLATMKKL